MTTAPLRKLERRVTTPPPAPGFAGPGHTAVEVLGPNALDRSDPFVLLMDDRIDVALGQTVGGPHPHAGLETVTLMLEGALRDRDEGRLGAGDVLWMNAARGIIHNEDVETLGRARVLQLWIGLPARERDGTPSFERISGASVPVRREPGVEVRLYSGITGTLVSPTRNRVPVTMVDVWLEAGAVVEQELPASYNGFVYVLAGSLRAGDEPRPLASGDVGWLDRGTGSESTTLRLVAGAQGGRALLYAGEPHGEPLVQHGPFVAGSQREIAAFHREFSAGRFTRMSTLAHAHADDRASG